MSSALETLRRDFGGHIIEPGGAEYESASRTLLASGNPAHVLRPGSVGDVQAGVRFAASTGLLLSVRSGGHGFAGFGTNDGGVVIDLSQFANVEIIDKERQLVRIGGGATWGQVAAALTSHGLAISSGDQPYADTLADGTPPPPGLQFALRSAFADKESVPEVLISPRSASHLARPSRCCMPSGLISPAHAATDQQFLRGRSDSSPSTKSLTRRRGSTRANRPAIRLIRTSNASCQRAGFTL